MRGLLFLFIERFVIVQPLCVLLSLCHLITPKTIKMKILTRHSVIAIVVAMLFTGYTSMAQKASNDQPKTENKNVMKTYLIEREIPGAGKLTPQQLKDVSIKSCGVLKEMGPKIQWIHSYVTGDKLFCIYKAENPDMIRDHAKKGGFPCNNIIEVGNIISPATAN
jgi:hypothetical protein